MLYSDIASFWKFDWKMMNFKFLGWIKFVLLGDKQKASVGLFDDSQIVHVLCGILGQ